jgi:hypothetical protein
MAWTTPLTGVANTALTAAQWNASVRDNLLVTPAALATTAGSMWVSTGANAGAMRTPGFQHVAAGQTTSTTATFGDLATVGPVVVVAAGTQAIVAYASYMSNSVASGGGYMSYAVTGSSSIAATTSNAIRQMAGTAAAIERWSAVTFEPGLTSGSNTFTSKYTTTTGGTASFSDREMTVIPL